MATLVMPRRPQQSPIPSPRDASPQEMIATARSAPAPAAGALGASALSAALMWAAFTPLDIGPLGWLCLIPLILLVRLPRPTRWMYGMAFAGGLAFWLPALQWMRLGHETMYLAWLALAAYLALYFPVFVALSRVAVQWLSVPLVVAVPVVWVGLELLRGHLMTGFGWYYLGHTQYRWLELIQICDLVGAYGVSFVVALAASAAAGLVPATWLNRWKLLSLTAAKDQRPLPGSTGTGGVVISLLVVGATLGYGYSRRSQAHFQSGPRVALVQGNVTSAVKHDPRDWPRIHRRHLELTARAVRLQPDLIVWPETMYRWPLFSAPADISEDELQELHRGLPVRHLKEQDAGKDLARLSQMAGACLLIGVESIEADRQSVRVYNSAAFVRPDIGMAGRYDKLHRVIFGEYIPLTGYFPWLLKLTPFSEGFGIHAGTASAAFECKGARFAPIICFEDTVPHLVRDIVNATALETPGGARPVDFLVNLTNDGWFHGSSELDQHLITAAFRCVECRTPMVRAVNTGISAFIDGDGAIRSQAVEPETGSSHQVEAVLADAVPLDSRTSLYLRGGDWFGGFCLVCCCCLATIGGSSRWIPAIRTLRSMDYVSRSDHDLRPGG